MRQAGLVDSAGGLSRHDHLCWAFDSADDFRRAAGRFLSEGIADGQRVIVIADADQIRGIGEVAGFAAASASGAASAHDLSIYGSGRQVDPVEQVRTYAAATEQALADGFTGLRVAADATSLVVEEAARVAFARYEHLIDTYMTGHPFSAMCGYDRARLGKDSVAELACMHPLARRSSTAMRLFASPDPEVAAVLAGEIDISGHGQLLAALSRVRLAECGGQVVIDARDLSFIDHRGLILLVEHIRVQYQARTVLLSTADNPARTLAQLLRLPTLSVVTP